jgi:microcystin-dependent protein
MGQPFVGEIRLFAGNFAPFNWAFCNGQQIAISENQTLFQLIGTTYGGDGVSTFNLPNLQSRVPVHQGTAPSGGTFVIGQLAGVEAVTLTTQQMPSHNHALVATGGGQTLAPTANTFPAVATTSTGTPNVYAPGTTTNRTLNPATIKNDGGSLPHSNLQPYLAVNFIISLFGIFPSQS